MTFNFRLLPFYPVILLEVPVVQGLLIWKWCLAEQRVLGGTETGGSDPGSWLAVGGENEWNCLARHYGGVSLYPCRASRSEKA